MGRTLNLQELSSVLEAEFHSSLKLFREKQSPTVPQSLSPALDVLFTSKTQSFREALLGCALAKLADPKIDVRLPYVKTQGPNSFPGRQLDEDVVNPFLQKQQIPCSKGPYLAVFRRSITFTRETRSGLRDKSGYDAFLRVIEYLREARLEETRQLVRELLLRFIRLREAGCVELTRIQRLNLDQYGELISGLLHVPSGGLLPVLLSVAMFQTIKDCFKLSWTIDWQGINAADSQSGAGGDITILEGKRTLLAVEVTERAVDKSRVVSTFNTKIAFHGIEDYLFLFAKTHPSREAREAAKQYFGQGHDISFVQVDYWIISSLATIGTVCRKKYLEKILTLLDQPTVPAHLKIAWNDKISALLK